MYVIDVFALANGAGEPAIQSHAVGSTVTRPSSSLGDAGARLDATATVQYQRRCADLREQLADAEACNDVGRLQALRAELDLLTQELAAAGRGKRAASHAERARVTVSKGIHAALKRIDAAHPALGRHLRATIRTGYFCSYTPDPMLQIEWDL